MVAQANASDAQTLGLAGRLTDTELRAEHIQVNLNARRDLCWYARGTPTSKSSKRSSGTGNMALPWMDLPDRNGLRHNCGIFAAYAQSQAGSSLRAYVGVEPDPGIIRRTIQLVRLPGMSPFFVSLSGCRIRQGWDGKLRRRWEKLGSSACFKGRSHGSDNDDWHIARPRGAGRSRSPEARHRRRREGCT